MAFDAEIDQAKLERLLEFGPALAEGLDLETVLRRILDAARDITGARYAALGVLDAERAGLERFITAGLTEEQFARIGDLPRGRGVLGELIRDPRPLRLPDVSAHPRSYGFPVGHPPMTTFLGVPIRVRGEAFGNLYLTDKEDGEFDAGDEELVLRLSDWAGIAIENARLYGAVDARQKELQRSVEILETNVEIARAIGAETELDPVLELVAKRARALVEARGVAVALAHGDELVVSQLAGELESSLAGYRIPWSANASDVPGELAELMARATGAREVLLVPMVFRHRVLGIIGAIDRRVDGPAFSGDDQRMLNAFAASASIAVASAQRAGQRALGQSIAASERERARWARELHDDTLQDLGALRVLLSSARNTADPDALASAVESAIERLGDMSGSLRGLITDLRPAVLDQLGLAPALRGMGERVGQDFDFDLRMRVDLGYDQGQEPSRLTPDLELAVYRVVQEAVNNAAKHSGASAVDVQVREEGDFVDLWVSDDGSGFDPTSAHGGFGLTGIRERVEQHGGVLEIASGPDRGTLVHARLPARRASTSIA